MTVKVVIRKMQAVSNYLSGNEFQYARDKERANRKADAMIRDVRRVIADVKINLARKLLQAQNEYNVLETCENISTWYSSDMWGYYLKEKRLLR